MAESSIKKHVDYADQQVDEQAILDKYNAATTAQFNVQREQNRLAENKFYNQMYDTQRTAMDTIRQSNANAVSTGASRGVQAANELSALLGLQSESIASATELAGANRQTAQEETAAVLENVLNAYQQAQQEKAQLIQQGIEADSVDVQRDANAIQLETSKQNYIIGLTNAYEQAMANGNTTGAEAYAAQLAALGVGVPGKGSGTPGPISGYASDSAYDPNTKTFTFGKNDLYLAGSKDGNKTAQEHIYNLLAQDGFTSNAKNIYNIADPEQADEISQNDFGTDKSKNEAGKYIATVSADAKAGKIPVGALVQLNYGFAGPSVNYTYIYLGGTVFAKVALNRDAVKKVSTDNYTVNGHPFYVPAGYHLRSTASGPVADGDVGSSVRIQKS